MISDPHKEVSLIIENQKIPVWIYGNSKNPPIFFIHGFFNSFSEYVGDLPPRYLMKNYCVYSFDLPGFGKSKKLNIDKIEFINLIYKKFLKKNKVILFGISYGGLISIKYSLKYPNNVNALIIAGTPVFYKIFNIYKLSAFLPIYKNKKITFNDFKEFKILNAKYLSNLKIPTLLYYNSSDFVANIFMGNKLNSLIPNSRLFIAKNQNHSWLLHRIDKNGFLNEIDNFLSKI